MKKIGIYFLIVAMIISLFSCDKSTQNDTISSGSITEPNKFTTESHSADNTDETLVSSETSSTFETELTEKASEEITEAYVTETETAPREETTTNVTTETEESKETDATTDTYRTLTDPLVGYNSMCMDYIKVDGKDKVSGPNTMLTSYLEITEDNEKMLFFGWIGFDFPINSFGYAIDSEEAILESSPLNAEAAVIARAGDFAQRLSVSVDVSELTEGYHDFYLLASVNDYMVRIMTIKILVAKDGSYLNKYATPADGGIVGYNVDSILIDGVKAIEGTSTKNIKSFEVNTQSKKLTFSGWAGFKTDLQQIGYAFDNEAANMTSAPTNTHESAVLAAGGNLAKRFSITVDINGISPGEHTMYLLALIDADGGKIVKLMEFTLTVIEQCGHNNENNVWSAVPGEAKEISTCLECGETIARNTKFILCYEKITHGGGEKIGSIYTLDSPLIVDDIPEAFVTDKGLYFQGWLGINSGTKEYKWSLDGKEWFDVDASSHYKDNSNDVLAAIAKKSNELKLGFKDYSSKTRFYITVSEISNLPSGEYDVYLGAVPNNNPDAVITVMTVKNVTVASAPDDESALKTLNGVSISDYKISVEGNSYGVKYAQALLTKGIFTVSGITPAVNDSSTESKTILIRSSDTYNNGTVSDGEYYFDVNGDSIIIGGSGMYGTIKAAEAFIEAISGKTDATVSTYSAPIIDLNNVKAKLENGDTVNIGFIGDSVTYGHGEIDPWPTYFSDSLKEAYSDSTVNILNVAVSGSTSRWGKEKIQSLLLDKGYNDLVFLSHGTNDKYNGLTYKDTFDNYVSMIKQILKSNPDCDIVFVLCGRDFELKGISGVNGGSISPYMMAMIDVAMEYGIGIIDPMTTLYEAGDEYSPGSAMSTGWRYYMQDEVHPNTKGQELYGKAVYSYVSAALK